MSNSYVYKHKPGRGAVWLMAVTATLLSGGTYVVGGPELLPAAIMMIGFAAVIALRPRPTYGIKVDDTHLTLAAWRKPRPIPLDSIAYLQAAQISDEIPYVIVYRDKEREGVFALDLPDEDTLVEIMAERGIPVRTSI
ncbi:hypothetical protein [Yoonia sp.]|uniref:hypothetical protein n=1 Tax=Yoonia sp. TaxID=2212373 RepID=UPI002FD9342D